MCAEKTAYVENIFEIVRPCRCKQIGYFIPQIKLCSELPSNTRTVLYLPISKLRYLNLYWWGGGGIISHASPVLVNQCEFYEQDTLISFLKSLLIWLI